jgi:hypothetical protein
VVQVHGSKFGSLRKGLIPPGITNEHDSDRDGSEFNDTLDGENQYGFRRDDGSDYSAGRDKHSNEYTQRLDDGTDSVSGAYASSEQATEDSPKSTEGSKFTIPAHVRVRFARNSVTETARKMMLKKIKTESAKYLEREGISRTELSLADVQAEFENRSYCYREAIPLVRCVGVFGILFLVSCSTYRKRFSCRYVGSQLNAQLLMQSCRRNDQNKSWPTRRLSDLSSSSRN